MRRARIAVPWNSAMKPYACFRAAWASHVFAKAVTCFPWAPIRNGVRRKCAARQD